MIDRFLDIIEMLKRNKICYHEKDNDIIINYPFLFADKNYLTIAIKEIGDEICVSDNGIFYKTFGLIEDNILNFFKKNNIKVQAKELYCKLSPKFAYFDIEKFVKCLIRADFMVNGELKWN